MSGLKLTREAARKTAKTVKRVLGHRPSGKRAGVPVHTLGLRVVRGFLLEDLDKATDSETGATTAKCSRLVPDKNSPGNMKVVTGDREWTATNRDETLEGEEGDYIIAIIFQGEHCPIYIGCDPE